MKKSSEQRVSNQRTDVQDAETTELKFTEQNCSIDNSLLVQMKDKINKLHISKSYKLNHLIILQPTSCLMHIIYNNYLFNSYI